MHNGRYRASVDTSLGEVNIIWRRESTPLVLEIVLPNADAVAERNIEDIERSSCTQIDGLRKKIEIFFFVQDVSFELDILDMEKCTSFQRSVLEREFAVPKGKVTTYGRLAISIGNPRASRAVGGALRQNPFPLVIPCHRTVKSDGSLGGFRGSVAMKRKLLELEGIEFDDSGKIHLQRFLFA